MRHVKRIYRTRSRSKWHIFKWPTFEKTIQWCDATVWALSNGPTKKTWPTKPRGKQAMAGGRGEIQRVGSLTSDTTPPCWLQFVILLSHIRCAIKTMRFHVPLTTKLRAPHTLYAGYFRTIRQAQLLLSASDNQNFYSLAQLRLLASPQTDWARDKPNSNGDHKQNTDANFALSETCLNADYEDSFVAISMITASLNGSVSWCCLRYVKSSKCSTQFTVTWFALYCVCVCVLSVLIPEIDCRATWNERWTDQMPLQKTWFIAVIAVILCNKYEKMGDFIVCVCVPCWLDWHGSF